MLSKKKLKPPYPWGEGKTWPERARAICKLIPKGSKVIDFGAGYESINYFAKLSVYTAVDKHLCTQNTVKADFNAGIWPKVREKYDFAVCQGIVEYIDDVHAFLNKIKEYSECFLVTYRRSSPSNQQKAQARVNYFTPREFESLLFRHGFKLKHIEKTDRSEYLYFITK